MMYEDPEKILTSLSLASSKYINVKLMIKDGSTVKYGGTVQYASIFAKKYDMLVRYAFL